MMWLQSRILPAMDGMLRPFALALTLVVLQCAAPGVAQTTAQSAAADVDQGNESVEKVFAAVPFDQWVRQGPAATIPWKVHIESYGLSLQQRMRAQVDIELPRRSLANHGPEDRIVALIQLTDPEGRQFRDYELFRMKEVGAEVTKGELEVFWDMYVLPGNYQVT